MEILGYIASIFIGISLGLVGSGGSILTVPVLVYLMHINPLAATASSLFIVGATSLAGGLKAYSANLVDSKAVARFGLPSLVSIFVTRHYLLPAIPDHLFTVGSIIISKDIFLMIVFALLMVISSISMISARTNNLQTNTATAHGQSRFVLLILLGLLLGVLTGMLGAGGGFLIIPALVLLLGLPMKKAIGTSLLIIAINSLLGFLFSLKQFNYDWTILLLFTALAIFGIFIGSRLSQKIPGASLKKGFGWFILAMGIYIVIKELVLR